MTAWHLVSPPWRSRLAPVFRIASRQGERIADGFPYLRNNLIAAVWTTLTCSGPSTAPRQPRCKGSESLSSKGNPRHRPGCSAREAFEGSAAGTRATLTQLELQNENGAGSDQFRKKRKSALYCRRGVTLEVKSAG